jgi:hypothetical protein
MECFKSKVFSTLIPSTTAQDRLRILLRSGSYAGQADYADYADYLTTTTLVFDK